MEWSFQFLRIDFQRVQKNNSKMCVQYARKFVMNALLITFISKNQISGNTFSFLIFFNTFNEDDVRISYGINAYAS